MKRTTVILAAGGFPRKGTAARRILEGAARVVCCDGAADAYRKKMGRNPSVVVGDCDSVRGDFPCLLRVHEQVTNDLEKAIQLCRAKGWKDPVILGATGKREDHAIGNLFRTMEHGLEIFTDYGQFLPVMERSTFHVAKGAAVSIFATPGTRMKSVGLEWPLDHVKFENFYCATLNRANARKVVLEASKMAYAYFPCSRINTNGQDYPCER